MFLRPADRPADQDIHSIQTMSGRRFPSQFVMSEEMLGLAAIR